MLNVKKFRECNYRQLLEACVNFLSSFVANSTA